MSREGLSNLNVNTLIGNVLERGRAWHWRADLQGTESNHYDSFIPVADVERRLFNWEAVELPVNVERPATFETMQGLSDSGMPIRYQRLADRKAIAANDNDDVFGLFKQGYTPHQYRDWLLNNVARILDDNIGISSAGLLRNRAVAWVEISMPDTIQTPEGVAFRPNLLATTSLDGSLATTYKRTVTNVVCDNTHSIALAERGATLKFKHSRNSIMRISDARIALDIVHSAADDFAKEVAVLTNQTVTESQWASIVERLVPMAEDSSKRGVTMAQSKRAELNQLYFNDPRVTPWAGTAFGAYQAVNTWENHLKPARSGTNRAERNMLEALDGSVEKQDSFALAVIQGMDFGRAQDFALAPLG